MALSTKKPRHQLVRGLEQITYNPYSNLEFARQNDPSSGTVEGQTQRDTRYDEGRYGDGKLISPKEEVVAISKPPGWPYLPPQVVARPGTLYMDPHTAFNAASDQPNPQVNNMGHRLVIQRSGRVNRTWHSQNPGVIQTQGLEASQTTRHTAARADSNPYADPDVLITKPTSWCSIL